MVGGVTETLVIGASAAGLATAAELGRRGRAFEIVEAENVVAAAWRRHYDRLHLHTPKGFSALRADQEGPHHGPR
jgi:cation diffusion facilitator CzcD-associated flavoprotein CzcO